MSLKKCILLLPMLALTMTITGCSVLGRFFPGRGQPTATPLPLLQATATPPAQATATLFPTATSLPANATPLLSRTATPMPSRTLTQAPTVQSPESGGLIQVEMTEAEVNAYLANKSFSKQGAAISDLTVTITPARMQINGYVQHLSTGFAGDMLINGTPNLVNGALYFQIESVELGPQFSGLVRTIAQSVIQEAIQQESGVNGMPIPIAMPEGVTVTKVTLGEGKLLLEGVQN